MSDKLAADVEQDGSWDAILTRRSARRRHPWALLFIGILTALTLGTHIHITLENSHHVVNLPENTAAIKARCESLKVAPGPSPDFHERTSSDRFVPGTKATLIKNATIWTGNENGNEVVNGDVLLDKGLIKIFGRDIKAEHLDEVVTIDAQGGWVTPGIVDLHSHLGVFSVPILKGAIDGTSHRGNAQPWLRSIDGLNTHDESLKPAVAGGVTTALILPSSESDIGGQAYTIKLRPTQERSPISMLLEPPFTLNSSDEIRITLPPRWRHMKHACGENPSLTYGNTRLDNIWDFRQIYDRARQIKEKQDAYCARVIEDDWDGMDSFPEELKYEALVDVLRGRVKVHVHCYEAVDLDGLVRLTNEFKFPIAAFHHAHEAYLVPDLLKKAYGHTPATALFATTVGYKREAYRGSEFAPRILAENDIPVVMKSDHPVLNSRYLVYEAQQAHYYGLPEHLAIASVTSTPAKIVGMDHRVGFIRPGYDADLVLWDSHPLALGATPRQVFIDGIAQFDDSYVPPALKPEGFQTAPETPNFDKEAKDAVKYDGLPPLEPIKYISEKVIFTNITSSTTRAAHGGFIVNIFEGDGSVERGVLVVQAGKVVCIGTQISCSQLFAEPDPVKIDLQGGAISPGLISFGSNLGLEDIMGELSTKDGLVPDPLEMNIPIILGGDTLIRAVDGLQFATRHAYLGYRAGVTIGVTPPENNGFLSGLNTAFRLGSAHKLEKGALVQDIGAVHVTIRHTITSGSVSTQVAALRRLLLDAPSGDAGDWFREVANGNRTLVVRAESADVIATVLHLKKEVELKIGKSIKLTIAGAAEAHLLAPQLAEADVGVIIAPSRPFALEWEQRRFLPGLPITKDSAISRLLAHNVTVGIGVDWPWSVRNTRFDVAWTALDAAGGISKTQALALASTNLEKLLGLEVDPQLSDFVVTEKGDLFDFESKVVGVISPRKGVVDLF